MRNRKHIGKVRFEMTRLLFEVGILAHPKDLWVQEGVYRSPKWDLARWGSYEARFVGGKAPDGTDWRQGIHLSSWSTMTDCVKYGISISKFDTFGLWGYVSVDSKR